MISLILSIIGTFTVLAAIAWLVSILISLAKETMPIGKMESDILKLQMEVAYLYQLRRKESHKLKPEGNPNDAGNIQSN